jgi:CubicO group peptidase (beta-lactamase class C family)
VTVETTVHDPAEVGMSSARLDDAAALMQRQFDAGRSPMMAAVVARHGRVVFTHALGDQWPDGPAVTVDTVFPIASMSKPMTAAVVLALAERGLIGLNEPAALTLPELAEAHGDVLVTHLLTHTSGWHDDDQAAALDAGIDAALASVPTGRDPLTHIMLASGWAVPRRYAPGEMMSYGNFNYSVLGELVRRITGGSLDAAAQQYLFEPLGMTHSCVALPDRLRPHLIERPPGIPCGPDHPGSKISFNDPLWEASDDGASGFYSSVTDMTRFFQMLLDDGRAGEKKVLSRGAVRAMTTNRVPHTPTEAMGQVHREASWGFGFAVPSGEKWKQFGGGTVSRASASHGGAGGIGGWVDFEHGIAASYVEIATEADEFNVPLSWAANRFEDVITSAVLV